MSNQFLPFIIKKDGKIMKAKKKELPLKPQVIKFLILVFDIGFFSGAYIEVYVVANPNPVITSNSL